MSHTFVDKMMAALRDGDIESPVERLIGMRLVDFDRGAACYELEVRKDHTNPMGMVQGGIAAIMADAAMAMATTTMLTNDEMRVSAVTTADLFSRFLKPINAKKVKSLRAEARVVKSGRLIMWAECDLMADGECVGKFTATGIRVSFDQKDSAMTSTAAAASASPDGERDGAGARG
ncbi:MAG TPA: PaaI family thioesterase [Acidimicrobiales bacterium]|nr:PaaI family thioesterase [Acidimicrobiales bacterium]